MADLAHWFTRNVLCLICVITLSAGAAMASCADRFQKDDIVVAWRMAQPFTYQTINPMDPEAPPRGFAVDLWENIARELKLTTRYKFIDTIAKQEEALRNCDIDIVISPLTITAERMLGHDFSQQYVSSGLALAERSSGAIDFSEATRTLFQTLTQSNVLLAIMGFLSFNLLMAYLVYRYLQAPSDDAPARIGPRHLLEAITRTVALRGIGDGYTNLFSKLLEIFMAVVGTALSATIFGVLTTAFISSVGSPAEVAARDLVNRRVATIKCSTAQEFLREQYKGQLMTTAADAPERPALEERIAELSCDGNDPPSGPENAMEDPRLPGSGVILVTRWEAAVRVLLEDQADAVLGDWIMLTFQSRQSPFQGKIDVLPRVYRAEPYGWGIARRAGETEFRNAIDRALNAEMRSEHWFGDLEKELGEGSISPN